MYAVLYLVQFLLIAFALGMCAVAAHRFVRAPLWTRFCFGAAATPFFAAGLALTSVRIVPGADLRLYAAIPALTAVLLLAATCWLRPRLLASCSRRSARVVRRYWAQRWLLATFLAAIPALLFLSYVLLQNGLRPAIGHDALIYLSEGKALAEGRDSSVLVHGDGSVGSGLPPTHPHTPLFSSLLFHALCFGADAIGYPGDHAARLVFQLTVVLLVLALVGLAGITRRAGASVIAFLAFCYFSGFEYISSSQSRDAFRLIPMLLLAGLLIALAQRRSWRLAHTLAPAVAAALAIHGHTLNVYFIAVIAAWFLGIAPLVRAPLGSLAKLGVMTAIASALPLAHYVKAYLEHGNFLGQGMANFHFAGTPLMEAFRVEQAWGKADLSLADSLVRIIQPHGAGAMWLAAGAVLLVTVFGMLGRPSRRSAFVGLAMVSLLALFVVVPLSNVLRLFAVDLKEAFLSNYRYPLVAFMLCPPIVALAVVMIADTSFVASMPRRSNWLLGLGAAVLGFGAFAALKSWTYYESPAPIQAVVDQDRRVCELAKSLPAGQIWLTDRYSVAYFCDVRPVYLYTPFGRRFFSPREPQQALALLREYGVGLVSLAATGPGWWPSTAFHQALVTASADEPSHHMRIGYWDVFLLPQK